MSRSRPPAMFLSKSRPMPLSRSWPPTTAVFGPMPLPGSRPPTIAVSRPAPGRPVFRAQRAVAVPVHLVEPFLRDLRPYRLQLVEGHLAVTVGIGPFEEPRHSRPSALRGLGERGKRDQRDRQGHYSYCCLFHSLVSFVRAGCCQLCFTLHRVQPLPQRSVPLLGPETSMCFLFDNSGVRVSIRL